MLKLTITGFLLICLNANAELIKPALPDGKNSVGWNIPNILFGELSLKYQHGFGDYFTLGVPLSLSSKSLSLLPDLAQKVLPVVIGFGKFPEFRAVTGFDFMFSYAGFYVEPYLNFGYMKVQFLFDFSDDLFVLAPGVAFGYQTTFQNGLLVNLGIGIEKRYFFPHKFDTNGSALNPIIRIGYVF